jgi:hypothetical protein
MVAVEVLAHGEKYQQYAEEAQKQAERAPTDADRGAWLLIAESWLNLLPLFEGPPTAPEASAEIPLAKRLDQLHRLRANGSRGIHQLSKEQKQRGTDDRVTG